MKSGNIHITVLYRLTVTYTHKCNKVLFCSDSSITYPSIIQGKRNILSHVLCCFKASAVWDAVRKDTAVSIPCISSINLYTFGW